MKKCLKVNDVVNAYSVLENAKLLKLEDGDKIKVWKISRTLKPHFNEFNEAKEDAQKAFFTEEVVNNYRNLIAYEQAKKDGTELPMTEEEYKTIAVEFLKSKAITEKALAELLAKEVELEFEGLTEEAFGKLISSNDWAISQVEYLEFIVD